MTTVVVKESIEDFDRDAWNKLVSDQNPFVSYEFFLALEKGKCLRGHSGWHPLYFALTSDDGLKSAIVSYIKTDSYGEFIFDWEWARAYQQYGLAYYPKLTVAIPYSPISAPKILGDLNQAEEMLLPALWDFYQKEELSGLHFLFTSKKEGQILGRQGLLERDSYQFHWQRNKENNFEDYLQSLKKNRRKTVKRERREIRQNQDLKIKTLIGEEITSEDLKFFYQCYLNTIDKKWSQAYLSFEFFDIFFQEKKAAFYLVMAYENEKRIACSLYFKSGRVLFGRYWGCQKEIPFLHFELCLYQGLELALSLGLDRFEAGAQGDHKRLRGFLPITTKSYHHLKNPTFHHAVGEFIKKESQAITQWFKNE